MHQFKWVWSLTRGFRGRLCCYFLIELLAVGLSLGVVLWSKRAVDFAVAHQGAALKQALIIAVICLLLALSGRMYAKWLNERTRNQLTIQLQQGLIHAQMQSTWKFVKQWHSGDIQVRIHSDCQEIVQLVGYSGVSFVLTAIRLVASFGFLWVMDPMLALLIVGISPLFLFSKLYFRKLSRLNDELKRSESVFGNVLQENLRFRLSIRVLGLQRLRQKLVEDAQWQIYTLKQRLVNFSTQSQGVMQVTFNTGFLLTFIWGVYRLYTAEISFGTMTAFLQLVGRIQSPLLGMMAFIPSFIRFRSSVQRVRELLDVEVETAVAPAYIPDPLAIHIEQLSFRYEDHPVIDTLNARIRAGYPTALIGASGKGKTTLIRLLLALVAPTGGSLWLETPQGKELLSNKHRVNMAYVPQGDKLFSGTIRENLLVTDSMGNEEQIHEALFLACAEFVYDLPGGLETVVGESGYGLSEGQAQRIAIARAIMRNCSIWLFDEVTSALDPETSACLMERLLSADKGKILLFVTHDLKLAEKCSQVIYM